jgi:PAS domain S-box-containing protein
MINCIAEDKRGDLWIGTENGLNKYNYTTGNFTGYFYNQGSSLLNSKVVSIQEDDKGILWIANKTPSFYQFDPLKEAFFEVEFLGKDSIIKNINVNVIEKSSILENKYLWLCTDSGLYIYDKIEKYTVNADEQFDFITKSSKISNYPVISIHEDQQDSILWIGTWDNGLYKIDFKNQALQNFSSKTYPSWQHNRISSIVQHGEKLILGTIKGEILVLNTHTGNFESYLKNLSNDESLSVRLIYTLFVDETDLLWIGTKYKGIKKTNLNPSGFKNIYSGNDVNHRAITSSLHQTPDKTIWVGNMNGELHEFSEDVSLLNMYTIPENYAGISPGINKITSFIKNGQTLLLIGTDGGGLFQFNPVNKKFSVFNTNVTGSPQGNIFDILVTKNNLIWIGGLGTPEKVGLRLYNPSNQKIFNFPFDPGGQKENMPGNHVIQALLEDKNGVIWIGTSGGGLNKLTYGLSDDKTRINTRFKHFQKQKDKNALSHNEIQCLHEDKKGYIWIGTTGGGLNRLNPFNEEFRVYTTDDGLPSNLIYSIVDDSRGNLWISTSNGLSKFNVETEDFINFDRVDGLSANVFHTKAFLRDGNNRLFFGNINGGNYFHPDSLVFNTHVPPVKLTALKISNQEIHAGDEIGNTVITKYPPSLTNKIVLKRNFKVVTFKFAALDYTAPEKNKYKYQLIGFDNQMIKTDGKNRSVTYSNLKPGKYTFRVIASNNDNVWNTSGLSVTVRVKPPFYQSWAFKIIVFIIITGAIVYLLNLNSRKAEIQKKIIKEEASEKILEERNQLRTLIDNVPDLIYIKDKDCRFITGNTALMKTMGAKSESDILGKTDFDFYPYEIASKFFHDDQKVIKTGFPIINKEEPGIEQDKAMKFLSSTKVPLRDSKGKVIGLVGIGRNITREKMAEGKLKERNDIVELERNQLRTLIDNMPDRIYIKDKESRFIAANEMLAKIMGVTSPTELIGKCDHDFYNLEMANKFYKDEQKIIKSGKPLINIEETGINLNKEQAIILTTKIPLKNSKGESIGLVGIGRDITKIKRIEAQLRKQAEDLQEVNVLLEERQEEVQQQAEELNAQTENLKEVNAELQKLNATKDKFFSIIAHDLKNPFNAIISLSDFLTKDFNLMPDNEKLELVKLINISSENAYSLLENLLQWARTQTDRIKYNPQPLELNPIIEENFKFHKINSDRKNIKLEQEVDDDLMVYADKNMVNLVLRNLLSNAVKFTNINGLIKVIAKKINKENSSTVEISVKDNGVGIEKEYLEKLFRIDEHHSTSGTTGETGTGLGLIVCKEFIRKNSGDIHVESEKGKGSTFIFTLPPAN